MAKTRVYVSSTFADLETHRSKVIDMLEKSGDDVECMEKYAAADERPQDKCRQDASSCDVYICILAWRYGFVPKQDNPESKSITELEYEAAPKGRRLIFQLKEETPWNPTLMDSISGKGKRGKLIKDFRARASNEATNDFFTTPDDLAGKVLAAVRKLEIKRREADSIATAPHRTSSEAAFILPQEGHCEIGPLTLSAVLKSPRRDIGDAYPTGSNGLHFRFDLFNPNQLDFVVHAVEVETISYQPVELDFLQHGVGATAVSRLYKAEIQPALRRYRAIYVARKLGEYVRIVPRETEVFDLEVSTKHEGLYTFSVHIVGTLAGKHLDIPIDGTKKPIVFFAQARDYPVDRGHGGAHMSYSEYIEEMSKYDEHLRAYGIRSGVA